MVPARTARASSSRSSELSAPNRVQREPAAPRSDPPGLRWSWHLPRRVRARLVWLERYRFVAWVRGVWAVYQAAGGGLLARGLVYSALFAFIPGLLFIAGVAGLIITDPSRSDAVVKLLGDQLPPIKDLLQEVFSYAVKGAASASTVGLIGAIWGASRFYAALDDAMGRIFAGPSRRGMVARSLLGLLSVFGLIAILILAFVATSIASVVQDSFGTSREGRTAWQIASASVTAAAMIAGVSLVYRFVPTPRPTWRAVAPPSVAAGIAIASVTSFFASLAPLLIGAAAVYGTIFTIFSTMVWLATGFQILLIGAAWVRVRVSALSGRAGPAA